MYTLQRHRRLTVLHVESLQHNSDHVPLRGYNRAVLLVADRCYAQQPSHFPKIPEIERIRQG